MQTSFPNSKHIDRASPVRYLLWSCLLLGVTLSALGCEPKKQTENEVGYMATIPPVAFILRELTAGRAPVDTLLKSGASPHTYEPRPSDVMRSQKATALFSVSPLLDGWAANLPSREHIRTIELVPAANQLGSTKHVHTDSEAEHSIADDVDPHYWLDPLTVRAMLPALVKTLKQLDPEGAETYARNAEAFSEKLQALHVETKEALAPVTGESVVLFHPGFEYLLRRYDIQTAGLIEPWPGKEPTPKYLERLLNRIEASRARAIFTEPQLPSRPAEIVRRQTGLPVATLDPLGEASGRRSYEELIRYNVKTIRRSLAQ